LKEQVYIRRAWWRVAAKFKYFNSSIQYIIMIMRA